MKQRVSQRDLARLAGVSPMTVSLALRGHPSISPLTRERITQLAVRHHYRPDPALAALNAYRVNNRERRFQGTIGWITCFPTYDAWRTMLQMEGYFNGAKTKAASYGYHLEEFWLGNPEITPKRATQILLTRGIRGLIVAPLPSPRSILNLDWNHFSSVALGYSLMEPHLHVIMNHQNRNMKKTVHQLYELGYRKIGFAMPSSNDERVDHNYIGGYLVAQWELPSEVRKLEPLLVTDFSRLVFDRWLEHQQPDVVITTSSSAYTVKDWLEDAGWKVPKTMGLAVAATPYGDATLSGVSEDVEMVGALAVDAVVGMLHRVEQGIPLRAWSLLTDGTWHPGKTVRRQARPTKMKGTGKLSR